jgi:hypothetical protein
MVPSPMLDSLAQVRMLARSLIAGVLLIVLIVAAHAPAHTAAQMGYPLKVYFSRHPISDTVYGAVAAVRRVSPTRGVATYAIRQLLLGPTAAEARAGYYTEFTLYYHGPSTCGPSGFTIRLNRRGGIYERGTATLQLCRRFGVPGLGASARMTAEVKATLRQFATIWRVVILTAYGTCFDDESGRETCLHAGA